MPIFIQPAASRLREFNQNHEPKGTPDRDGDGRGDGGRFARKDGSAGGYTPPAYDTTAGVTSYRGEHQPGDGDRTNKSTFARMHELVRDLNKRGLDAEAVPAQGAWDGAWEPSWSVGINAGESWDAAAATETLAKYGKAFNQDAVLLMHRCVDDCNSEYAEVAFEGAVPRSERTLIGDLLTARGMGGWTWFKGKTGKTTLRMTHVPAWSDRPVEEHTANTARVRADLAASGYRTNMTRSKVRVEVFEREARGAPTPGVRSYDQVLQGATVRRPLPKAPTRTTMGTPSRADRGWPGLRD